MNTRSGFTTIEVLIAMAILSITMMGAQAFFTDNFLRSAGTHDQQALALQLAKDRIELIQITTLGAAATYAQMDDLYSETATTIPEHPGFTRTTHIEPTTKETGSGARIDFQRVTVTVAGPGLRRPVSRTVSVGAP